MRNFLTTINKSNCLKQDIYIIKYIPFIILVLFGLFSTTSFSDTPSIPLLISKTVNGSTSYNLSIKVLMIFTLLAVLPALIMTTTAFMRIIIVFSILRQAIGMPQVPSNQIVIGLSLIMTVYVMMPMLNKINDVSLQPYLAGNISEEKALTTTVDYLKQFMIKQTRKTDLNMFANLSNTKLANETYPIQVLLPAFITSELKTAFQIGFLLFLPFLIIDLVTASVLMSMGMMMLSPMMISLPFKLLFFVLVNGWSLIVTSLISSFRV